MNKILVFIFSVSIAFSNGLYDDSYFDNVDQVQNENKINKHLLYENLDKIIRFKPIFFNPSTNEVKEESHDFIDEIVKNYEEYKNRKITFTIIGYTDAVQTKTERLNQSSWFSTSNNDLNAESSQKISLQYAKYVQNKFESLNIPNDIIVIEQRGGKNNLYSGITKEGRDKNYRVMVSMYISKDKNADNDNDGIIDTKDKCPQTVKGHGVDENGCSTILNKTINYEENSYTLNTKSTKKIDDLVVFLKKYPEFKVLIYGHTANEGTGLQNQLLSEKRALSIRKYLMLKKIKTSRISVYGKSSKSPLASNKTTEGRAKNRRVEIKLY